MEIKIFNRMLDVEEKHWWFVGRRKVVSKILNELELPNNAKILEAGCGTGGNLKMLSAYGEVYAFEPSTFAIDCAKHKKNSVVHRGCLPYDIPYEQGVFDLVVALDVIEHIQQDKESLEVLIDCLKPGGILLVTVPAFQSLWSAHDVLHHHMRRYSKQELCMLTKDSNVNIRLVSYYNSLLFPIAYIARLTKKIIKIKDSSEDQMPSSIINSIFSSFFSLERFFIGKIPIPFGLSLIMAVNKNNDYSTDKVNEIRDECVNTKATY